jgi:hypothetical protein
MKGNSIIVFRQFDSAIYANIAKTKLDAYGIPCFLTEENMSGLYPGQPFNPFKVRLHLFQQDRETAISILEEVVLTVNKDLAGNCPICNSAEVRREFSKRDIDSFKFVFFGVFFPHRKINRCLQCNNEF